MIARIPEIPAMPHVSDLARSLAEAAFAARKAKFIDQATAEDVVAASVPLWAGGMAPYPSGGAAAGLSSHDLYMHTQRLRGRLEPYVAHGGQANDHSNLHRAVMVMAGQLKAHADRTWGRAS